MEAKGNLLLTLKNDDGNERSYSVVPPSTDGRQRYARADVGRDGIGRYWTFKVSNTEGCDFSVDNIDAVAVTLPRKTLY